VGGGVWTSVLLDWVFCFHSKFVHFSEILRCQLVNDGQKTPPLCHDCIVASL
jgi:hypothetical protein